MSEGIRHRAIAIAEGDAQVFLLARRIIFGDAGLRKVGRNNAQCAQCAQCASHPELHMLAATSICGSWQSPPLGTKYTFGFPQW